MAHNSIIVNGKAFCKLIDKETITKKVEQVATDIERDAANSKPLFLCVLNGSFIFAADVLRNIKISCEVSFIRMASYVGTKNSGTVHEILGLDKEISGRNVYVIEDIVETGQTMATLINLLNKRGAKSIHIAALVVKPDKMQTDITIDYSCFKLEATSFIVGYGLDFDGFGRNLPEIYIEAAETEQ